MDDEKKEIGPLRRKFDPESRQAKQGEDGENRLFDLIAEALRDDQILIAHGLKDPSANGRLGDILFRRSAVDAPLCGIEVKTSSAKYPDSVSLSRFEHAASSAEWLACGNVDPSAGWWFTTMESARKGAELKSSSDGGYYVVRKRFVTVMSFADLLAAVRGKFAGNQQPPQP